MIVKMKFLSISGPKNDIDRVCEVYLSKYEMQLENAAAELKTTDNLQPFCGSQSIQRAACEGRTVQRTVSG